MALYQGHIQVHVSELKFSYNRNRLPTRLTWQSCIGSVYMTVVDQFSDRSPHFTDLMICSIIVGVQSADMLRIAALYSRVDVIISCIDVMVCEGTVQQSCTGIKQSFKAVA